MITAVVWWSGEESLVQLFHTFYQSFCPESMKILTVTGTKDDSISVRNPLQLEINFANWNCADLFQDPLSHISCKVTTREGFPLTKSIQDICCTHHFTDTQTYSNTQLEEKQNATFLRHYYSHRIDSLQGNCFCENTLKYSIPLPDLSPFFLFAQTCPVKNHLNNLQLKNDDKTIWPDLVAPKSQQTHQIKSHNAPPTATNMGQILSNVTANWRKEQEMSPQVLWWRNFLVGVSHDALHNSHDATCSC